jgi:hypothetical protein
MFPVHIACELRFMAAAWKLLDDAVQAFVRKERKAVDRVKAAMVLLRKEADRDAEAYADAISFGHVPLIKSLIAYNLPPLPFPSALPRGQDYKWNRVFPAQITRANWDRVQSLRPEDRTDDDAWGSGNLPKVRAAVDAIAIGKEVPELKALNGDLFGCVVQDVVDESVFTRCQCRPRQMLSKKTAAAIMIKYVWDVVTVLILHTPRGPDMKAITLNPLYAMYDAKLDSPAEGLLRYSNLDTTDSDSLAGPKAKKFWRMTAQACMVAWPARLAVIYLENTLRRTFNSDQTVHYVPASELVSHGFVLVPDTAVPAGRQRATFEELHAYYANPQTPALQVSEYRKVIKQISDKVDDIRIQEDDFMALIAHTYMHLMGYLSPFVDGKKAPALRSRLWFFDQLTDDDQSQMLAMRKVPPAQHFFYTRLPVFPVRDDRGLGERSAGDSMEADRLRVRLSFDDRLLTDQEAVIQVVAKVLFGGNTARLKNLVVNVATGAEEELDRAEPDAKLPMSLKIVLARGPNKAITARNAEDRKEAAQALEKKAPSEPKPQSLPVYMEDIVQNELRVKRALGEADTNSSSSSSSSDDDDDDSSSSSSEEVMSDDDADYQPAADDDDGDDVKIAKPKRRVLKD